MPPSDLSNLYDAVDSFVYWMEGGTFLTWEAVVCEEQGLALTSVQKKALGGLLNFGDPDDDQILYIDEIPRPSEPWYVILNKIAPCLLIEPFRTFDIHDEVQADGWQRIMAALEEHGQGLSLPQGVASFREVVVPDVRHKLWLQYCFDELSGLGQFEELTLAEEEQLSRIDGFIERLRECKESVLYFGLTLELLLTRVILPERDRTIFVKMMLEKLGLGSVQEEIAGRL
jgi:hypothetical protein